MSITMAGHVTVNEDQPRALAAYLELVRPLLSQFGIKVVKRFRLENDGDGALGSDVVVIFNCPNREAIDALFNSPEYRAAIPYRDLAFSRFELHPVT